MKLISQRFAQTLEEPLRIQFREHDPRLRLWPWVDRSHPELEHGKRLGDARRSCAILTHGRPVVPHSERLLLYYLAKLDGTHRVELPLLKPSALCPTPVCAPRSQ